MSDSKGNPRIASHSRPVVVRRLGIVEYTEAWRAMKLLTSHRDAVAADEFWFLQHPPVFTLGQAGRRKHVLSPGNIPVIDSDRGGQVTYHAPGQLVAYILYDLKRAGIGIKRLVETIEQAVIDVLESANLTAARMTGAPGVYVNGEKIAALGLRVRNGCSYHGLAFNVDLDLEPFSRIDPCGMPGLKVTSLRQLCVPWSISEAENRLLTVLAAHLGIGPEFISENIGNELDDVLALIECANHKKPRQSFTRMR